MASQKQKAIRRIANPIETASNSDGGFVRSEIINAKKTVTEQFTGTSQDFISQLLGTEYDYS